MKYTPFACKSWSTYHKTFMMADFLSFVGYRIHETGIFTYIWFIFMANIGTYMTHESYGYGTYYMIYRMDRDWDFIMGS